MRWLLAVAAACTPPRAATTPVSNYDPGIPHHTPVPRKVATGLPGVVGSLDKNVVNRYVLLQRPAIEGCYDKALTSKPALEGRLVMTFVIDQEGHVMRAGVVDGVDADLDACVLDIIRKIEFAKPQGGIVVVSSFPLTFTPDGI
jgi:hypothetical protein